MKQIDKFLRENGVIVLGAVCEGVSSQHVGRMCAGYSNGQRVFGRYGIQQAKRVCETLVKLVDIVENKNLK